MDYLRYDTVNYKLYTKMFERRSQTFMDKINNS
jgi:hypothetical protein